MKHPKISKLKKIKYFFTLLKTFSFIAIIAIDETILCRIISDLTLKGLSLNKIREHIQLCYGLDISKHSIALVRKNAAEKAKKVNHNLDKKVASKITIAEVDEIFQGSSNVILGAADKKSTYVMKLKSCPDRTDESIKNFLDSIAKTFYNIRVVITDLFISYKKVVKEVFIKARHLCCHVHARRIVMRKVEKLQVALRKLKKSFEMDKEALLKIRKKIETINHEIRRFKGLIKSDRANLASLNLKKKTSKSGRSKTIDAQINATSNRISKRNTKKAKLEKDLQSLRLKRDKLTARVRKNEKKVDNATHILRQSARLASKFYDLLADKSSEFTQHLEKFQIILDNSPYPLANKLLGIIKGFPQLFSLRKKRDLKPNYQNTNTIEGIFGLFRPLLNSTRLLTTTEGTDAYCELFRLYHNTTLPFTGINNKSSPIERLGIKMNGKNYLDLLFPTKKRVTHFMVMQNRMKTPLGIIVNRVSHPMCE